MGFRQFGKPEDARKFSVSVSDGAPILSGHRPADCYNHLLNPLAEIRI